MASYKMLGKSNRKNHEIKWTIPCLIKSIFLLLKFTSHIKSLRKCGQDLAHWRRVWRADYTDHGPQICIKTKQSVVEIIDQSVLETVHVFSVCLFLKCKSPCMTESDQDMHWKTY